MTLYPVPARAGTSCMDAPQLKSAWLLPPVIVGLYLLHTAWSWALAGAIAVVVGTLVALDYRGVAARIPWMLGQTRLGGAGVSAQGVERSPAWPCGAW